MSNTKAYERLNGVEYNAESDLHIGTVRLGSQLLRVGIKVNDTSTKPPLLIFNGIGANLELLTPFISLIEDSEVIIFDAPGCGGSSTPLLPYTLRTLATLTSSLLNFLGHEKVDVLGLSWGGSLAQQFAVQYPNKCEMLILAAAATGNTMILGDRDVYKNMMSHRRYNDKNFMINIAPSIYGGDIRKDPTILEDYSSRMYGGDSYGYMLQLLAIYSWSSLHFLKDIKQPTLIMTGLDDPLIPIGNAMTMYNYMPNSRLEVIDCGHLFIITRAKKIAKLVSKFRSA